MVDAVARVEQRDRYGARCAEVAPRNGTGAEKAAWNGDIVDVEAGVFAQVPTRSARRKTAMGVFLRVIISQLCTCVARCEIWRYTVNMLESPVVLWLEMTSWQNLVRRSRHILRFKI